MGQNEREEEPGKAGERIVSVAPLVRVDRPFSYRVPATMAADLQLGSLVRVPLGRRSELGVVVAIDVPAASELSLKYLHGLEQPFPVLDERLIKLASWMEHYYACAFHAVLEVMIPGAVRRGMKPRHRDFIGLARRLEAEELEQLKKRAPRQYALYQFLASQMKVEPFAKNELMKRMKLSPSTIEGLVERGIIELTQGRVERNAYLDEVGATEVEAIVPVVDLTKEQAAAYHSIMGSLSKGAYRTHLLHGVTGSGKTEVYLRCMKSVLDEGGGALYLVPEVALTPQTVGRLRGRLEAACQTRVVVWHSHLSEGERYDSWRALATGEARVVVGARSAVFAPVRDLRLIVVDEEHEPAYKQDETPRYHGRDVAVYRAFLTGAVCILGSATPSLESLLNVERERYTLDVLTKRVVDRSLPLIHVADMRREKPVEGTAAVFSRILIEKLRDRFEKKEQSILFINRRGYHAALLCPDCGYTAMCDHCDLTLTHHRAEGKLRCHLCGFEDTVPTRCPHCRSPQIRYKGKGTQRIEDMVQRVLPGAKVQRVDADTMQRKDLYRSVLGEFRRGRIDVLVGTQMIAKGLDFPNVTLVGLVDADLSMQVADFRAAERTFQLLIQVAGRAGRGDRSGEVVVQTCTPFAPTILYARQQDFDGFAEEEMQARREFGYPPYRHLIHHLIRGKSLEKVKFYAEQWIKRLEASILVDEDCEVRGPAPCPVEKIQDNYRYQIWYFVPRVLKFLHKLNPERQSFQWDKEVIEVIDVDPVSLL